MSIDVRGGIGGIGVGLEDVESASRVLASLAGEVAGAAARVASEAVDAHLLASYAVSPVTGARAEAALVAVAGPSGLVGQAAALSGLSLATEGAVTAYREGERAVAAATAAAQNVVMYAVGAHAPQLAVGVLALDALGVDVEQLVDHAAYEVPAVGDLGGGIPGLLAGLSTLPVAGPIVVAVGGERLVAQDGSGHEAGQDEPGHPDVAGRTGSTEEALRVLGGAAALVGMLQDSGPSSVVEEPTPRAGAQAPRGVADLANDVENLSDADGYPAHVRVVEVPGEHGSAWLVEVSGTQVWDPHAGSNPFDVTSDARLMAQESTVLADGVQQALARAQAASGRDACDEPVLLAGHSLGGIVAAGLAASPRFRAAHRVTHVVTLGSPVARMPVPATVSVLSLEHTQDAVPRLDGLANPDRRGWVTVTRDLHGDADGVSTASAAHALGEYAQTGASVDASPDQSLQAWRDGSREFFEPAPGSVPVVRDFRVARGGVSPVGASP